MLKLRDDRTGAASMLVVIFLAIILTVVTIGFIRLALNEQRIATDDDLTTRAYYAAESGVEDAKRAIRSYIAGTMTEAQLNGEDCQPPTEGAYNKVLSTGDNYDIEYTCMLIDLRPPALEYEFQGANETIQVPINSVDENGNPSTFNEITIRWHINNNQADGGDGVVGTDVSGKPAGNEDLRTVPYWNSDPLAKWPAMLKLGILQHPYAGPITRDKINQFFAYLSPEISNGTNGDGGNAFDGQNPGVTPVSHILPAACDDSVTTGGYYCEITFGGSYPTSQQYYLRLGSMYRGTHVQVEISQSGTARYFDKAQVVVDVTGRAGLVYRRVQTTFDLVDENIVPDTAITSLTDICKNFYITNDYNDFGGQPGTSCTEP